jgi:hypothetical protein
MSLESARAMRDSLEDVSGYCVPLSVDSLLKHHDLPQDFYRLFKDANDDPNGGHNKPVSTLIRDYFGVEPQPDTELAPVAKYNAFGASVQTYCPDVDYDFSDEVEHTWGKFGITGKQLRLRALLKQATILKCLILFNEVNSAGPHVKAIDVVDYGGIHARPSYVIRDGTYIQNDKVYEVNELSGLTKGYGGFTDEFAPLPETNRSYYPDAGSSWELTILPPEPT